MNLFRVKWLFIWVFLSSFFLFADDEHTISIKDLKNLGVELNLAQALKNYYSDGITLKDLLDRANNNYSLQSYDLLTQQARKELLISKLGFVPTLNATYNFNNVATSADIAYSTQSAQLSFGLDLDMATYYGIKQKGAELQKNMFDARYSKQNIYLQVVQQYYTYFNNQSNLLTLQQKLEQLQSDVNRTQILYQQGLKTIADLESLKAQAAQTEYQIGDAKLALEQSKLILEYLTNSDIDKIKRVKVDDPSYMLNDRDDIKSTQQQIESLKFQNKALHYFPTLTISDTYTYNIQLPYFISQLGATSTSPFFAANYATLNNSFGISVTYQLFAKIGLGVQKQSYTLSQLSYEKQLAYAKSEQKKDEQLYRKAIEVAKQQIESAKAGLISANASFDNMKKQYDSNLSTFTEYLQALSTKYDAEYTLIQALNNYELQKANYIFYSGQELEKYVH